MYDRELLGNVSGFLLEGKPPFDRFEYPLVLTWASCQHRGTVPPPEHFNLVLENAVTRWHEDWRVDYPPNWRGIEHFRVKAEKALTGVRATIEQDIADLRSVIGLLQDELRQRRNKAEQYGEICKWIADDWGAAAKLIINDDYRQYEEKRGRPRDPWILLKPYRFFCGATLKECGFPNEEIDGAEDVISSNKTASFYQYHRPRAIVALAFASYIILYRNEVLRAASEDIMTRQFPNNKALVRAYLALRHLANNTNPLSLLCNDHLHDSLHKAEEYIDSLFTKRPRTPLT